MATTAIKKPVVTKAATKKAAANVKANTTGNGYLPGTAIPSDLKAEPKKRGTVADPKVKGTDTRVLPKKSKVAKPDLPAKAVKVALTSTRRAAGKAVPTTPVGRVVFPNVKPAKVKKVSSDIKFRGFVIPAGRKQGDSEEGVPTIQLRKVADVGKLFEKLPKGAFISASSQHTISVFNRAGMLIAELHTYDSTNNA